MLSKIYIKNFALIDSLNIDLHSGLQVITGETGAGKSIILGALRLILGERADLRAVNSAEAKSVVEVEFRLDDQYRKFFDENDLDFDAATIIRREILPSGKSRAFVNDVPVMLDVLKRLSVQLIDIHSQFESSDLFTEEYQFRIIDGLAGNRSLLTEYQTEFNRYRQLKQELAKIRVLLAEGNKEADYKNFLLTELTDANLDELDFAEMQSQLAVQENAGVIAENLSSVLGKLGQEEIGILSLLNDSRVRMQKVADLSQSFADLHRRLDETYVELKDVADEVEAEAENLQSDPLLYEELLTNINRINALLLKHNAAEVEELKSIRDQLAGEQGSLAELEDALAATEQQIVSVEKKLTDLAKKLAAARAKAVLVFVDKTEALLKQLGLEKAKVEVELQAATDFNSLGRENIRLLFQANAGFPLKPIQTAISGGERSRVMLAIKKIMAENAELPTLILDEIDTGVSGRIAEEMGKVMRDMSRDLQLIVITHLAQVAAKGDDNYKVMKSEVEGRTRSTIVPLTADEKLQEIAQLLSGSRVTDAAIEQAKELMK
ncbi:MAG: DNA repair protein RecN [Chryseobacterium sp.]|nr:MAG: DNA repair protein RecN [Chryseobacterium sp.]